ncbi:uncharacterized protein EV422DRAFT_601445 [Fimicolochytrium jonesii]|uniref:uncharacterized protein n=1 Tax=Fimicolochytrium jonesii TaxID=1396493 RepID=UPI0022FECC82|nr:uncharacterized protein EV422DRAFT_601445 [Fimicolochytrium jonesii]KAI8818703.1 hypothetical protein EV422DRAFT_601445 [Fimicolochytrium jonesii]
MWGMYAPYLEFKWRKKGQKLSLDDIFAPVLPNDPLAMRPGARIHQFVDKAAWAQNRDGDHQPTPTPGPTHTTTPSAISNPNIGFAFGGVDDGGGGVETMVDSGGGVEIMADSGGGSGVEIMADSGGGGGVEIMADSGGGVEIMADSGSGVETMADSGGGGGSGGGGVEGVDKDQARQMMKTTYDEKRLLDFVAQMAETINTLRTQTDDLAAQLSSAAQLSLAEPNIEPVEPVEPVAAATTESPTHGRVNNEELNPDPSAMNIDVDGWWNRPPAMWKGEPWPKVDEKQKYAGSSIIEPAIIRRIVKTDCWLNDQAVNRWCALLQARSSRRPTIYPPLLAVGSTWLQSVKMARTSNVPIRLVPRSINVAEYNILLFPSNPDNLHWVLFPILVAVPAPKSAKPLGPPGSPLTRHENVFLVLFDSKPRPNDDDYVDKMANIGSLLWDWYITATEAPLNHTPTPTVDALFTPRQTDDQNCGTFVCMMADAIARGAVGEASESWADTQTAVNARHNIALSIVLATFLNDGDAHQYMNVTKC